MRKLMPTLCEIWSRPTCKARHWVLPIWLEWDTFASKNGSPDFATLRRQVGRLRGAVLGGSHSEGDSSIGCILLSGPVLLWREHWVASPAYWPADAVQGKSYDQSAASEDIALLLLYGLAASGQLKFRKLGGYKGLDRIDQKAD